MFRTFQKWEIPSCKGTMLQRVGGLAGKCLGIDPNGFYLAYSSIITEKGMFYCFG
jgi:hypothetical protein